jgi:4-diphosphocytidyl-2-C-methyl-D-erythritol kinase
MREIRIPAFAKINLRLDILGKRCDGYHELRTIFQTISLHDELKLRTSSRPGISLAIHGNDRLALEPIPKNLAYQAVAALRRELRIRSGVEIELHKKIPAGGGLGGGSSDAAAALLGYLRLTGKKLPAARLIEIAASLGADVPVFLLGGRALGVNRGDEVYPLADIPKQTILVVAPRELQVSTPAAFRWVNAPALAASRPPTQLTKAASTPKLWGFCALCWSAQGRGLSNDFERPVFRRHPRLAQIKGDLLRRGALEASLAGSGSAVFGVFPSPALARRAAVGFPSDQTFVCETISRDRYLRAVTGTRRL